ncbi:zinc-binding alcohol dehydrogenase family protein [Cyanobium sp. CH-040]|uniref:zinc-binding alcohol dehydrogenase family protein n=1 Tax=Cyanobium sp. CH-040 TaxID=2823708 RepID=UPI0020CEC509|nr:zinc-binding alcohol dehydrogenase family protein [Cyanobium sp. CH-040]MCP9928769.1 zinc-binding alcohol dehydrogenase family protein [Cyanobium sp. CH-040]
MRAVGYRHPAALEEPGYLEDLELPDPQPGPHDLLVAVEAVGVNPVDLKVRARELPPPGQWRQLGWDATGTVVACGAGVEGFSPGERVWYAGALQRPGCHAQLHAVDHRLASRAPASLSPAQAAAMPLTAITAWELLFERLAIPQHPSACRGEVLLVSGAAGGVGSLLLQLARRLTGLTLVGTASRPESRAWALSCGAHHVLDHRQQLRPQLEALGIAAVQHVASLTHTGEHYAALVDLLAPQGRFALIDDPDPADLNVLALKRKSLSLHWELMFTRSLYETADMARQGALLAQVAELVEQGVLTSTLTVQGGPICSARLIEAHRRQATGRCVGKQVLVGWS